MKRSLISIIALGVVDMAFADVVFDGKIGKFSGKATGSSTFLIPYELGQKGAIAGSNLFHSFSEFNLARGQTAVFSASPSESVTNILARVSGGPSTIQGTVRSTIQGANLFLMNPAGIVFGQGAQVDVNGAFMATTADFIELADGSRFTADPSASLVLSSAAPAAFGFLNGSANQGILRMEAPFSGSGVTSSGLNGKGLDLGLVGRKVEIQNSFLKSAGGSISLTAVGGGEARVSLASTTSEASPDASLAGEVVVSRSAISVSGASGGEIRIRGGKILIDGAGIGFVQSGAVLDIFSGIDADAKTSGGGGVIRIDAAEDIALRNSARVSSFSLEALDGGTINLRATNTVTLATGADVVVSSTATGNGGLIRIDSGNLLIDGTGSSRVTRLSAQSNRNASGNGGSIEVALTGTLSLLNGGSIQSNSLGSGGAGRVSVSASGLRIAGGQAREVTGISSSLEGSGGGGVINVRIDGHTLIEDRGRIGALNSGSSNVAGLIDFHSDSLHIIGLKTSNNLPNAFLTGIIGQVTPNATGRGANLRVNVPGNILLEQGGLIDNSSLSADNSIRAGNAGSIEVTAGTLWIDRMGSEYFTGVGSDTEFNGSSGAVAPTWNAGDVSVKADHIELRNGGLISSSTGGTGNAGSVRVMAGTINATGQGADTKYVYATGSGIVAATRSGTSGKGGNVTITTSGLLTVQQGALFGAQSLGDGSGGTVTIQAGSTRLLDGGSISSNTAGVGRAGGISLTTGELLVRDSEIGVRAAQADAGTLAVDVSGDITMRGGLVTASAGQNGGDIVIRANGIIYLTQSVVTADAQGNGGNITFEGARHLVLNGTTLSASAVDEDGGNINISTGTFFANNSVLRVTSARGAPGTVTIETLDSLSGGEETQEVELLNPDDVLQPDCTKRAASTASSFTQAGRGGTSRLPGGYLPSFRIFE